MAQSAFSSPHRLVSTGSLKGAGARGHGSRWRWWAAGLAAAVVSLAAQPAAAADDAAGPAAPAKALKVLPLAIRTDGPKSLDPVRGSTQYDNIACSQVYETLLTFKYSSPRELEPLLLAEMPTSKDNGKTWNFKLRPGVTFHDNACFPGGKGRAITTDDVFYSLKRLADPRYNYKNWWLLDGTIVGLNQFKDAQEARSKATPPQPCDYSMPVSGLVKKSDTEFSIELREPVYRFLYTLAQFQTSVVAREAVEKYGDDVSFNPVGTGPFVLDAFKPKQSLTLNRNPAYREVLYPAREAWSRDDRRRRMDRAAGQKVPFVDRMEYTMFVLDQPMWLQFQAGKLGYIEVPNDFFEEAFEKRTKELRPAMAAKGITAHNDLLLDFIFRGFNMEDDLLGGYSPESKALRQAICLAIDLDEINEAFYSGINHIYDGPIPPGMDGYPEGGKTAKSYRGLNLEMARTKLAEAGWPGGKNTGTGEQLVIKYYTSNNLLNQKMSEMEKRQLAAVGIQLDIQLVDFSTLIEYCNNKKAPLFGFAWGSDYPDAENNLAIFYSPNVSPGSNHFNYNRREYDELYRKILPMTPSPERTKVYEQMRDMLIEDAPFVGSMARTRYYIMAPWVLNCRPTERTWSWFKYLDVDESKQPK